MGLLMLNLDEDLACLSCGTVLVLRRKRKNDTRTIQGRDRKKKIGGGGNAGLVPHYSKAL